MKLPLLKKLCLAIAIVNMQSAFALESLDDDSMSQTTGEGIALLPENYSFMMNGANPTTGLYTDNSGAGTYGTGYIRYIPVGPLTATATTKGYQKADAWLYGVTLGQSKKNYGATIDSTDWGVPFGAISATPAATDFGRTITSWGTADNPWVVKTVTDTNVPNFVGTTKSVTYLGLEAPLYNTAAISSLSAAEQSAYNLKLGYWMDIFMRDATQVESGYTGLSNRLRLAYTWNGFSMNGSNLKIFQTLDGVTPAMGGQYTALLKINGVPNQSRTFNYGLSTSYNNTFGMAGLLRFNSGATDASDRRGVVSAQTVTRAIHAVQYLHGYTAGVKTRSFAEVAAPMVSKTGGTFTTAAEITSVQNTNDTTEIDETYSPMSNGTLDPYVAFYTGSFSNTGICTSGGKNNTSASASDNFGQCLNSEGFTTRRFKASGTNTWTPPVTRSVMRFSTQEFLGAANLTGTPALGGAQGLVPDLRANAAGAEGVFFYDANINLVLGNLYQPIILNVAPDGNNFSFEIARIPNVENVYKKIYTRYESIDPVATVDPTVTYEGSTCNVHKCGTHPVGTNATISSTYQASSATHSSISVGSTQYNAVTNQLSAYKGVEAYGVSIGELKAGTGLASQSFVDYTQVWTRNRTWGPVQTSPSGCGSFGGSPCFTDMFRAWSAWAKVDPKTPLVGQPHPSLNRSDPYETIFIQNYNNQILGIQTTMPSNANITSTLNAMTPIGATVSNNFGSAVIDGLLIQHLKFSTTGL